MQRREGGAPAPGVLQSWGCTPSSLATAAPVPTRAYWSAPMTRSSANCLASTCVPPCAFLSAFLVYRASSRFCHLRPIFGKCPCCMHFGRVFFMSCTPFMSRLLCCAGRWGSSRVSWLYPSPDLISPPLSGESRAATPPPPGAVPRRRVLHVFRPGRGRGRAAARGGARWHPGQGTASKGTPNRHPPPVGRTRGLGQPFVAVVLQLGLGFVSDQWSAKLAGVIARCIARRTSRVTPYALQM